ncbi:MAG: hypothetical protein ABI867_11270 [Kofleriaceae bacterium]
MRALLLLLVACGENLTPQPELPPLLPNCTPDRDGVITEAELPVALGVAGTYYASVNAPVALAGTDAWVLDEERAGDEVIALGPVALAEQWYATMFPGAAFSVDAGSGLDGVFHQDAQGLWLHGTASHDPMPAAGKTLVRYATPISVLRFPITDGDAFSELGDITAGTVSGLPFIGADTLDVEVAGSGRLDVPYVRFSPVLRVRSNLVRTPSTGTPIVGRRSTSFLFECFGEVARADSNPNEPNADFTTAAALRRFALGVTP